MRSLIFSLLVGFIFLLGCSQEEQPSPELKGGDPLSELTAVDDSPEQVRAEKVVPIKLSPEDQEKAKLAPEGMVFIKGGCFIMGNNYAQVDEQPEHEVCVDDFFMDRYEMTQKRWNKLMGYNPSKFSGEDLPVEQVNYFDAQRYIKKSNGECRLPTEAEWEYAAKGGTDLRYYWGNLLDERYVWYEENSDGVSHEAGQKDPNQYGLYDLLGNVWEWTDDWYGPHYRADERDNPKGFESGGYKVIRGGAFDSSPGALRITNRTWLHPKNRVFPKVTSFGQIVNEIYNYIGFRCVKSL